MKEGILIIDKPAGMTSHDVVDVVRKKFSMKRIGHSGTLDPVATGVLVLLIGRSTKLFDKFVHFDKEYEATLCLGTVTTTGDSEGKVISESDIASISERDVREAFSGFLGSREQIPPMVSAIKYKGRRLYELARRGIEVERKARPIVIYDLNITRLELPQIDFFLKCSKGTYVRRLGEEIGEVLGCGGFISRIRRLSLGPFTIDQAISLEEIDERHLKAWTPPC